MRGLSENLSSAIISEAKTASRTHFDKDQLELEKSKLIKQLNYTFGKGVIFEKKVKNYKTYATIQTLLNEWRSEESNFSETVKYEIKLNEWLTSEEEVIVENKDFDNIDKVTLKIMSNKFNEKYKGLTESQANLISKYVTSKESNNEEIVSYFRSIKEETLNLLENYKTSCDSSYVLSKYDTIYDNVKSLNENNITDDNLKRFLTVSKLQDELLGE
jgi:hypothetical protein